MTFFQLFCTFTGFLSIVICLYTVVFTVADTFMNNTASSMTFTTTDLPSSTTMLPVLRAAKIQPTVYTTNSYEATTSTNDLTTLLSITREVVTDLPTTNFPSTSPKPSHTALVVTTSQIDSTAEFSEEVLQITSTMFIPSQAKNFTSESTAASIIATSDPLVAKCTLSHIIYLLPDDSDHDIYIKDNKTTLNNTTDSPEIYKLKPKKVVTNDFYINITKGDITVTIVSTKRYNSALFIAKRINELKLIRDNVTIGT